MSTESVRVKIFDAALELFSEKGYSAASMDEIAAKAGMKGPNLYKYFKGKETLFSELHQKLQGNYEEGLDIQHKMALAVKSAEDLKRFSMIQIRYTISSDPIRKLRRMCTIEQYKNPAMSDLITDYQFNRLEEQFSIIFSNLMDLGLIERTDPKLIALQYFAPASLLVQLCDRYPDREQEMIERIEALIDYFIERHFIHQKD